MVRTTLANTDNSSTAQAINVVQEIAKLKAHPAWSILSADINSRKNNWSSNLTKRLISGDLVDQREIDRKSGFFAGCLFVINMVEGSDKEIERLLREATKDRE